MTTTLNPWPAPKLDARISAHIHAWEKSQGPSPHLRGKLPFITVSRQYGCEAIPLAFRLAEILNERFRPSIPWVSYDRELLAKVAEQLHLKLEIVETLDGRRRDMMTELFNAVLNVKVDEALVFRKMAEVVRSLAMRGHTILVGRGSHLLTQDLKMGLHIRMEAPLVWRVNRVAMEREITTANAEKLVAEQGHQRDQFLHTFFLQDPSNPFLHDLIIDTSRFNLDQMAEIVFTALSVKFGEVLAGN